jgi:hypothetical protein
VDTTAYRAEARIGRLPSGLQAEMTAQIVAMAQPELAGELRYWAEQCGVAASTFHRETLAAGLAARRPALEEQFGKIESSPKRKRKLAEWVKRVDRRSRRGAALVVLDGPEADG